MARTSTIKRLPADIRELIARLRERGRTIDEILAKLRELDLDVSRSALGRHVKTLDEIAERIRANRTIAEAVVERLGDAPESRVARLNIELTHSLLTKLLVGEDGQPVELDAKEAMFVSTSLQKLSQAAKSDLERELKIRKDVAKEAVEKLDNAAKEAEHAGEPGLSAERIAQLRRDFLGVGRKAA
ncbi:MAG: DUF3486 family protein [Kiloniellaceae bacterium]